MRLAMEDHDEFGSAFQATESPESGDDSPEGRRNKARRLVEYVQENYPDELRTLRWITETVARDYARRPCMETKFPLMERIYDEVSCRLAIEHVHDLAAKIVEGWDAADYAYGQDREFLSECRKRFNGIRQAIRDARPQQMRFAFAV